ncbi:hypothetical protein [Maribacter antarcticus]|uniref:hypothetical protein n=1 Tax=Maribacter antarcticus TaxID=505250 RepID=UPI000A42E06E|nr:hypothetical protein [Maribacter antarcticus]
MDFTKGLSIDETLFTGYSNELRVKTIKGGSYYNPITTFVEVEVEVEVEVKYKRYS